MSWTIQESDGKLELLDDEGVIVADDDQYRPEPLARYHAKQIVAMSRLVDAMTDYMNAPGAGDDLRQVVKAWEDCV